MRERFIADLNISPLTVEALGLEGWDIGRSSRWLPARAPDSEILNWARREGRVVISQDLDFSLLLALGGHSAPSLITLRLTDTAPECVTRRLLEVVPGLEFELEAGCAVTIQDKAVRARRLPILSGKPSSRRPG